MRAPHLLQLEPLLQSIAGVVVLYAAMRRRHRPCSWQEAALGFELDAQDWPVAQAQFGRQQGLIGLQASSKRPQLGLIGAAMPCFTAMQRLLELACESC